MVIVQVEQVLVQILISGLLLQVEMLLMLALICHQLELLGLVDLQVLMAIVLLVIVVVLL